MKDIYVFDLDGTIVIDSKKVDKQIVERLKNLQAHGASIIFATSRSLRGIRSAVPDDFSASSLILCNGAFSYVNNKILYSNAIDKTVCDSLVEILEKNKVQFYVELGTALYVPSYVAHPFFDILRKEACKENVYSDYCDIRSCNTYKIAIVEKLSAEIQKSIYNSNSNIFIYKHADGSADIVSETCSKWNMLKKILIEENAYRVIAFGNDNNDIELLKNADIKIAVCPVNEKVKNAADIVLNDFYADSLLQVLDRIENLI